MANTNKKAGAKPKVLSTVTHLDNGVAQENGASKGNLASEAPSEAPVDAKPAQAEKKEGKAQIVQAPEPTSESTSDLTSDLTSEPTPEPVAAESAPVEKSSEGKAGKAKTGKVKAGKDKDVKDKDVKAAAETPIAAKKSEPEPEKPAKMKRLTLDIAKPLHKAIKAKAVDEGIPMVDMLRSLLEEHYGK
jgi:predicted DNA binding CopG/RHH family protein